ncbi:MAG: aldo/keto reductase [Anaerolineales bacterium]|nr:aldo/keto reductase [Anaerolineales bacterium]
MLTRTLGKSNLQISALGMGCWAIGGPWTWAQPGRDPYPAGWGKTDDAEAIRAIHAALDAGVNFFDTAANYGAGHSEVVVGNALKGRRDQVVIATKFGHIINEDAKTVYGDDDQILANVRKDVENSLRRLQTDVIDIYQLHAGDYDPVKAVELRGVLEDLVTEGKIRWYGWSTDLVDRAEIFSTGEHCTSIQFRLNALFDNIPMRELCASTNMAGINKDPLNKGILTGKFTTASTFPADDIRSGADFSSGEIATRLQTVESLREVLTSGGRTMAQGALAWIWAHDANMVPIPGFKNVKQATENAKAMDFGPLMAAEMRQIDEILGRVA